MVEVRLDLSLMDTQFDSWYKKEENLSGVLNAKATRLKNDEFRMKIEAWKKRENERKRLKKRAYA